MVDAQNQAKVRTLLDTAFGTLCSTPPHIDERCCHQPPFAIALAPHWNASAQQEPGRVSGYALDHLIKRRTAVAKQATKTKPLVIRHKRILAVEVQSRAAYDFSNGTNRFSASATRRTQSKSSCVYASFRANWASKYPGKYVFLLIPRILPRMDFLFSILTAE